jgi:uncharacterized protein YjbI with pentapeptide repeats
VTSVDVNDSGRARRKRRFKRSQTWAGWAQVVASLAALATAGVAFYVAHLGQVTVNRDAQAALQQSEETQLSAAITALGSSSASERVAGMLLLAQNTANRFALAAKTGEGRAQLFTNYTTALQTLSAYLSSGSRTLLSATAKTQLSVPFGPGYGRLVEPGPIDLQYAVDQVSYLLSPRVQRDVMTEREGQPAIDLSSDELSGAYFAGVNFGWVYGDLFAIDLRGASLANSSWSRSSDLSRAYLQCADLRYSDFRGADLRYSDLSGANVQGADFTGAELKGVKIAYVYGIAKWPANRAPKVLPEQRWDHLTCMKTRALWLNAPKAKTPSHSARKHGSRPAAKHSTRPARRRTG